MFIQDHCESNNIITDEQAGGKRGVWGCSEQLLINKAVLKETKQQKRNLVTAWLDYAKAFDSIPHSWLFLALRLAKIPEYIIKSIENLSKHWNTIVTLSSKDNIIKTDVIRYMKGILQGDSLSVIIFILCVNPLSHIIKKFQGYAAGKDRNNNITHNFFVDDLKIYCSSLKGMKKLLDFVTTFSRDIGMTFGQDKCAYLIIEKGKIKTTGKNLTMNNVTLKEIEHNNSYKYLGQDENISYGGQVNKERVRNEYFKRVKKIWFSELSGFNKSVAHNSFAVPILTPTFGILDWTIARIQAIDIKTRKLLCLSGNFHPNSDVDRLYLTRKNNGRGLKSVQVAFECRIVSDRKSTRLNSSH